MQYPAIFQLDPKDNCYTVTFKDIPEALTQGYSLEEAKEMAQDALITSMDFYFDDNRSVPLPSLPSDNDQVISLPISVWVKVLLLNTMLEQRISQAELAKRLGKSRQEMQRIVNLHHSTKIDTMADALACLGKKLSINLI